MSEAQATVDHYATLGVTPRSEVVVIRAAYLALMRLYHPDKSSSSESSERAQAITAAYAVLGDVDKRLKYDWDRRRAAEELALPSPPRLTKVHYGFMAASVLALAVVPLAFRQAPQKTTDPNARVTTKSSARTPSRSLPASSNKLRVASVPAVAMPISRPTRDSTAKPVAIADRAPTQEPKLEEALRVKALPPSAPSTPRERPMAATRTKIIKPVAPAITKCVSTKPGAETALCNNDNLAALDRLAATFHGQSLKAGNAAKRAALVDARNGFLDRREVCRSEPCLRGAYLRHMREISKIIESN